MLDDAAVAAGLEELETCLAGLGMRMARVEKRSEGQDALVLQISEIQVDAPTRLSESETQLIQNSTYEIITEKGPSRSIYLKAPTPLGLAYSLFEVADRIRVNGAVPEINKRARPELPYRIAACGLSLGDGPSGPDDSDAGLRDSREKFEQLVRKSVKYGYNIVTVRGTENYVPCVDSTYAARSEKYRKHLSGFIDVAHAYHLKILLMGDEFCYLPELLERFGAEPSVKDDNFWHALQTKYRELLAACPELDGAATRIGEHIPHHDFLTIDIIHSEESEPDPRIEERYHRFIRALQQVVVGEFGKIYLHRTWTVNVHEQHSVPQVYQKTFTDDVPRDDLLISIKLTSADQWYHCEPYNTTFGVTPHTTVAEGEIYSGYQGRGFYIDYPARYFQAALEWAVDRGTKGLTNGISYGGGYGTGLTSDAILYIFSHLGWDPRASVDRLTEDWVAATFGPDVRKEIAEIFLLGAVAVRDGLYLRQPGLHNWDPIRHLRTNNFVLKGDPGLDNGKGHDKFLKGIYLECKPWFDQTISELDNGVATCQRMIAIFEGCRDRIGDPEKAELLQRLLEHGLAAIGLNSTYVRGFLRYFRYRERPTGENQASLAADLKLLEESLENYRNNYDYYRLRAVSAFLDLGSRAVKDLDHAERILRESPTREDIKKMFAEARHASEKLLDKHPDALLIASWKGTVDGRDILRIKDGTFTIEHISDDSIISPILTHYSEIPRDRKCKIVVKPLEVRGTAYVREQPTPDNEYTVTIYLEDLVPGKTVFRFELYAIFDGKNDRD